MATPSPPEEHVSSFEGETGAAAASIADEDAQHAPKVAAKTFTANLDITVTAEQSQLRLRDEPR